MRYPMFVHQNPFSHTCCWLKTCQDRENTSHLVFLWRAMLQLPLLVCILNFLFVSQICSLKNLNILLNPNSLGNLIAFISPSEDSLIKLLNLPDSYTQLLKIFTFALNFLSLPALQYSLSKLALLQAQRDLLFLVNLLKQSIPNKRVAAE